MDEDEFYSASEGESSENESSNAPVKGKLLRKKLDRVEARPPAGLGLELYGAATRDSVMSDEIRPILSSDEGEANTWSELDCTEFKVRGHTYLDDKVKHPSEPALMKTVAFELFFCDDEEVICASTEPHCKA
ncbi:WD repeat-containing protein 12, partial [Perkinsus olseni]